MQSKRYKVIWDLSRQTEYVNLRVMASIKYTRLVGLKVMVSTRCTRFVGLKKVVEKRYTRLISLSKISLYWKKSRKSYILRLIIWLHAMSLTVNWSSIAIISSAKKCFAWIDKTQFWPNANWLFIDCRWVRNGWCNGRLVKKQSYDNAQLSEKYVQIDTRATCLMAII